MKKIIIEIEFTEDEQTISAFAMHQAITEGLLQNLGTQTKGHAHIHVTHENADLVKITVKPNAGGK